MFVDNLNKMTLRSRTLCGVLGERRARLRILGVSKSGPANCRAFIVVTGNALGLAEDLVRRLITIDIDPKCEDPEQRRFAGDFLADIARQRVELLEAVLVIWRWGRRTKLASGAKPLGGFERWCAWVRDPLLVLGCVDPVKRIAALKSADPDRLAAVDVFQAWWLEHESKLVTVAALADAVKELLIEDPTRRTRQALAARVRGLANTEVGGYRLTCVNEKDKGRWSPLKYKLEQLVKDEDEDGTDEAEAPPEMPVAAPTSGRAAQDTVASMPFMITSAMKEQLRRQGLSDEEIAHLTPQEAHEKIRQNSDPHPIHVGRLSPRLQVLGPELEHACVQCQLKDDKVYLIRDNSAPGIAAQPLHEQCAPFFFGIRGTPNTNVLAAAAQREDVPAAAAADAPAEPLPTNPVER